MFVWFAVGFFLALTFECCPDLPDSLLVDVLRVSGCSSCKGLEGLGFGDKALDLFLDRDDELFSVRCAEGHCSFDFLCVASVVFGGEQCVDGIERIMSVSEGWPSLSVANMGDGGFLRSIISCRAADTARMSCGL